jgi:hypothetical protein
MGGEDKRACRALIAKHRTAREFDVEKILLVLTDELTDEMFIRALI